MRHADRTSQILSTIVAEGLRRHAWNVQMLLTEATLGHIDSADREVALRLLWALHTAKSHMVGITPVRPSWLTVEEGAWLDAVLDSIVKRGGRPPHPDAVVEDFITSMLPA